MSAFNIGFVIFPQLTQLDFTGPLQVLARLPDAATHIIAKSTDPVPSDCGLGLVPTCTFQSCPTLYLICVPGGSLGVADVLRDRETIEFVRRQASGAKYVTSVCTGAFVLGAAGLLRGRRATTHWAFTDLLPLVGATYERSRVVKDGNVITAVSSLGAMSRRDAFFIRFQTKPDCCRKVTQSSDIFSRSGLIDSSYMLGCEQYPSTPCEKLLRNVGSGGPN